LRTTLDIDDDVLEAAREIAASRGVSTGRALSELARNALGLAPAVRVRNRVPLITSRTKTGRRPTLNLVNRLRDG
jgi:hypothetical protein